MKKYLYLLILLFIFSCEYEDYDDNENFQTPLAECIDGIAKIDGTDHEYSCSNYNLMGHVSLEEMDAEAGNDCWGWTDPVSGKEYALMGLNNGTGFIDISDPTNPIYLGKLPPTAWVDSSWRDMKVYKDHVYIVSEAPDHGLQVFNLAGLRGVESKQVFSIDYTDNSFGNAQNIAINEDSGYAYIAGSCNNNDCKDDNSESKGLYVFNLAKPLAPELILEDPNFSYSHDAQIVTYKGPDQKYDGKEIYIGSNEDRVVIVDVSDKANPKLISEFKYDESVIDNDQYTHQAWFTEDFKYLLLGDEFDELEKGCIASGFVNCDLVDNIKTYVIDVQDLEDPNLHFIYKSNLDGIDHNGYIKGTEFYQASYTNGLRVIDVLNVDQKSFSEKGFFNTYHHDEDDGIVEKSSPRWSDPGEHKGLKGENIESLNGAWSVYPFFKSENIIISDINSGLFIVKKQN